MADGNDYKDYLLDDGDPDIIKWGHMKLWVWIVIGVASLICCVCSCSCFYNYSIVRTREPPFWVPPCCPDCLFPKGIAIPISPDLDNQVDESEEVDHDP